MDPAVAGARLASSVVTPLIKRLFVQEGPGAGLTDRPVRLSRHLSFTGEKRTLTEGDLRRLSAELVHRAVTAGERPVTGDEEGAVTDALARTLSALGELSMTDVQAVELGHLALARELRRASGHPERGLGSDAARLHERLLETACLHVLHFFSRRSTFVARSAVEQARRQAELIAKTDEVLARLPRPDGRDAEFERRYAEYVARKHGTLTIVGIDLHHTEAAWPLDTAYLGLELTEREPARGGAPGSPGDPFYGLEGTDGWTPAAAEPAPVPLPTERLFSGRRRVLLRGAAGSGKTTLIQWLAVTAARREPPAGMAEELGDRVPFVLPLRSLVRAGSLPSPGAFLAAARNPLHSAQPEGWADRVLRADRGLLLIDGLDEIPERERERARGWLADLLIAYPGNLWLVTSRPSAVGGHWLAGQDFAELALAPMSREDVASFIDRWHAAARAGCRTPEHAAGLDGLRTALRAAVHTQRDLGRLVTNPLMCAMVCALHRARNGYLPPGRKELYEEALRMLLSRRDLERDIPVPGDIQLTEEPQIQLLQRIAHWLIRNGRTELAREHAERMIGDALPSVPAAARQGDAPRILRHLLLRSGLLREPADGTVEFVHRTFQDFLGAKAAVEEWDIGLLVRNAADAQWEDVIRMSVAHARPRERAEILRELTAAGDRAGDPATRMRLHLLAAACLEHAVELDPAVRTAVEERTAALIPPSGPEGARELAAAGPLVLELLPGPEELTDSAAATVVITASHIESAAALPFLTRFRDHRNLAVRSQLAWAWSRFDTRDYAEEVLAHLHHDDLYFTVQSPEQLTVLGELGGRARLDVRGARTAAALPGYATRTRLTHLMIRFTAGWDVTVLRPLKDLRALSLTDCGDLPGLTDIAGLPLRNLTLSALRVPTLAPLRSLTALEGLVLDLPEADWRLDDLPPGAPLTSVVASGSRRPEGGLRGIGRWPRLDRLLLGPESSPRDPADWDGLSALPALRTLHVADRSLAHRRGAAALPGVTDLVIHRTGGEPVDLSAVPGHFPGVVYLEVREPAGDRALPGTDLSPLAGLERLRVVLLHHTAVHGLRGVGRLPDPVTVATRR
ncbi:NACHT domain-containing protein [Streptomyces zingiberis]|uniref:NACHT domain-containing protein n=1 Tax=Streptomyces zingiberis TaxID=2053010 RepID=A0ABX1C164_9ACTN|nr:NACHT domain-containing protein [Streptomyces zingiberis]NJQ03662.1 NACHT domain-containing protein [Streptomyces zingiberis]